MRRNDLYERYPAQGKPRRPLSHRLPGSQRRRVAAPHRLLLHRQWPGAFRSAGDHHAVGADGKEVLAPMEVKLKVKRFDPEGSYPTEWRDYTVDMPDNATVLDTLIEVREYHDGTL